MNDDMKHSVIIMSVLDFISDLSEKDKNLSPEGFEAKLCEFANKNAELLRDEVITPQKD